MGKSSTVVSGVMRHYDVFASFCCLLQSSHLWCVEVCSFERQMIIIIIGLIISSSILCILVVLCCVK